MTDQPNIAAIVPAAGLSSRFTGANKLVQPLGARSIVTHVVRAAKSAGCHDVIVVSGYEAETLRAALRPETIKIVHNAEFEQGMGSSISTGVRAADDADALLIWPADMPLIKPASAAQILGELTSSAIVVPTFNGKDGHPVLFSPAFRKHLLQLPPDHGARSVLESNPESIRRIEIADPGIVTDIDSREELDEIIQKLYANL